MKEILPYVVPLLGLVTGWLLASATRKDALVEDVKALREELAKKSKLVDDQAKALKFLHSECEAYRNDRDEAWRREALLKKTSRELRGRAEYWRAKYKAIVNIESDPTDGEIVITPNPDAEC